MFPLVYHSIWRCLLSLMKVSGNEMTVKDDVFNGLLATACRRRERGPTMGTMELTLARSIRRQGRTF